MVLSPPYISTTSSGRLEEQKPHFKIVANHHLEDQEQLAVRDEPVPIHVVHLECDLNHLLRQYSFKQSSQQKNTRLRTSQLCISTSTPTERRQPRDELLEVDGTTTVLVKDGNHPARERVVGDLWNLQELVAVDRARSVTVVVNATIMLVRVVRRLQIKRTSPAS